MTGTRRKVEQSDQAARRRLGSEGPGFLRFVVFGLLLLGSSAHVQANLLAVTTDDLWDISQGNVVTAHTGVRFGSDITNMFGGTAGSVEPGNTLFRDGVPTGTVHAVEWQTAAVITLRSFVLFAAHDEPPRDATARGFSRFTLYAFNAMTSAFDIVLFELFPSNPYGDTPAPSGALIETNLNNNQLRLAANVTPTTTDRFRAEFVQFGFFASNASGPRVMELDGFDTFHAALATVPVPEPTSLGLLASGLALLALGRPRKTQGRG